MFLRNIGLAFCVCVMAGSARAYVLPGSFILNKAAEKRAALKIADVEMKLRGEHVSPDTVSGTDDVLQLKLPDRLRWTARKGDTQSIFASRDGAAVSVSMANKGSRATAAADPMVVLFVPRSATPSAVVNDWQAWATKQGIDTKSVALKRFASRVAFVMGKADKSQLWIDKDTFVPLRVIYSGEWQGKQGQWDVQWRDYGSKEAGENWPRVIERYFAGKLVDRAEVLSVNEKAKLADAALLMPSIP